MIGKSRSEYRGEVPIADAEALRQLIVERQFILIVERHRLVVEGRLGTGIGLVRQVRRSHKAITPAVPQRVVGMVKVCRLVNGNPAVVDVRDGAAPRIMKGKDGT